jgi:hypothetical protein
MLSIALPNQMALYYRLTPLPYLFIQVKGLEVDFLVSQREYHEKVSRKFQFSQHLLLMAYT